MPKLTSVSDTCVRWLTKKTYSLFIIWTMAVTLNFATNLRPACVKACKLKLQLIQYIFAESYNGTMRVGPVIGVTITVNVLKK